MGLRGHRGFGSEGLSFLSGFVLSLVLIALAALPSTAGAATVRFAITQDESTLNPYTYVTGYPGYNLLMLLYDSLFFPNAQNVPEPWLAQSYSVSPDGTVWTLKLRRDVLWHDGKPLTADDVKFTYEYVQAYPHSRWTAPMRVIERIETPDPYTVVFRLKRNEPGFALRPLADVPILPKHIWEGVAAPKEFNNSTGSGPYVLVEYKSEQFYRLQANSNYFRGHPLVDEIVIPIIADTTSLFTALRVGQIDATSRTLTPELVAQFEGVPGLAITRGPGYTTTLLQFNAERFPLSLAPFRRAVALAIDRRVLVDTILLGFGTPGSLGFIHPQSPWYNQAPEDQPGSDPAAARAILDELSFTDADGDGIRETPDGQSLSLTILVYSNNPLRIRTAELISQWLADVGVAARVRALDPTTVDSLVWPEFDVAKGRNFDMAIWGWSASVQVDPGRVGELVHSDPNVGLLNVGGYRDPAADRLAEELDRTVALEARQSLVKELQARIAEGLPFVTLYYPDGIYVYRPRAFDRWVYQTGQGIVSKLSFLPR